MRIGRQKMEIIKDIVFQVEQNLIGRIANKMGDKRFDSVEIILGYVNKAGGGNHLEIGTLFGGSSIPVAIFKDVMDHDGIVFCIDPLAGYYEHGLVDRQSNQEVTPATLFKNIEKFKVGNQMMVMQSKSIPFPKFSDIKFSTAYIDGEHRFGVPLQDWNNVKDLVTNFVIFDNCDDKHPDVQEACEIASNDPDWKEVYHQGITYVVERV